MRNRRRMEEPNNLTRRTVLSRTVGAAAAIGGLGGFTGTASAWQVFDVNFEECSEVRFVVSEGDLEYDQPLIADVVVASWGGTACRRVEFTEDVATRGQCGDKPVITYAASGAEKILGVVRYNAAENPVCLIENDNECTDLAIDPDAGGADCVPDDLEVCDRAQEARCDGDTTVGTHGNQIV